MTIKKIFLDLDGTLTDSSQGIYNSIRFALKKFALPELTEEELRFYVGPPLLKSFMENYQLNEEKAQKMVEAYREYYREFGIHELNVYDGIPETLAQLSQTYDLFLATSKPEIFAKKILENTDLKKYFKGVYGADLESTRVAKGDVIAYALEQTGSVNPTEIIMIGDRSHDILGAKENNMQSIGVLYGFGDEKELSEAGADRLAKKPADLVSVIAAFN